MDGRVKPGQDGRGSEASRRQPTHSYRYKSIFSCKNFREQSPSGQIGVVAEVGFAQIADMSGRRPVVKGQLKLM